MPIEIKIPEVGESITEVQIAEWLKAEGDAVQKDEPLVVIDSEKTTLELPSPENGVLGKILHQAGSTVQVGEVIAHLEAGEGGVAPAKDQSAEKPVTQSAPAAKPEMAKAFSPPPSGAAAPESKPEALESGEAEPVGVKPQESPAAKPKGKQTRALETKLRPTSQEQSEKSSAPAKEATETPSDAKPSEPLISKP